MGHMEGRVKTRETLTVHHPSGRHGRADINNKKKKGKRPCDHAEKAGNTRDGKKKAA